MDRKTLKNIWIALAIITLISGYLYFFWTPQPSPVHLPYRPQSKNLTLGQNLSAHSLQSKNSARAPQEPPKTTSIPRRQEIPLKQDKAGHVQRSEDSHGYLSSQQSEIPASLVIDDHPYLANVPPGASVYDLMQVIRKEYPFTFDGKDYTGLGFFVEEINRIRNNDQNGIYWIYYINGKKASVGISTYKLNPHDVITWKYEKDI